MRVLKEWAESARAEFELKYKDGGCTCFLSPPCGFCTHLGNPMNQNEDDSCWEDVPNVYDVKAANSYEAKELMAVCVDNTGLEHIFDLGKKYKIMDSSEGNEFITAVDKNGVARICFVERFAAK